MDGVQDNNVNGAGDVEPEASNGKVAGGGGVEDSVSEAAEDARSEDNENRYCPVFEGVTMPQKEIPEHYVTDMQVYKLSYDQAGADGWLIPAWAGAMDAFGSRAGYFGDYLIQVIKLEKNKGPKVEKES